IISFIPPILIELGKKTGILKDKSKVIIYKKNENDTQDLDMYFDPEYAKILDSWGEKTTWIEIQMLLANCKGKVLDIACGSGVTMRILNKYKDLEVYGCDISDLLIKKAVSLGIAENNLKVTDATKMDYKDAAFDYSYSIGSLEHFTEKGISEFIAEAARVTKYTSMHMMPTSKSGTNEGWMSTSTTIQTFHNNSDEWWMNKYKQSFREVIMLNSRWDDGISYGRWFICKK
ncbi:MAG: class I SAM-dependent methyltransferase, partial [Chitinophagales bacterium]|nr:class I SAM-dependent methyltransferase [Chitinophagales bacterium]